MFTDISLLQIERSNEHQVVVRNVDFNLSGNFSCEVTTDAPGFLTKYAFEQMLVVGKYKILLCG